MNGFKYILIALFSVTMLVAKSQEIAIGQWRDNLPYANTIDLEEVGNKIYCATPYSLFSYNKDDAHLKRISKINGLSDIGINALKYNKELETLVVLYSNSNIDLITEEEIINIPDIKISSTTGSKVLNNITFYGDIAYLSTGFGIVVLDIKKKEIKETYMIGHNSSQVNVNDVAVGYDTIYAATDIGLLKASLNAPNLLNFEYWETDTIITSTGGFDFVKFFNNKLYANKNYSEDNMDSLFRKDINNWEYVNLNGNRGGVYNIKEINNKLCITKWGYIAIINDNHELEYGKWLSNIRPKSVIVDKEDSIWVAETNRGLVQFTSDFIYDSLYPSGPYSIESFNATSFGNSVIFCEGGYNADWSQKYNKGVFSKFKDGEWSYMQLYDEHEIWDISSAAIDPYNENHFFLSSYLNGLVEINGNEITNLYSEPAYPFSKISYIAYDKNGNLWIAAWERIYKMDRDNNIQELKFNDVANGWQVPDEIIFDSNNNPWVLIARNNIIFAHNGTKNSRLSFSSEFGNMKTMEVDHDGEIWIGSDKGISVVYSPESIFDDGAEAERIVIMQDGYAQHLLETETITDIEIDGANRKWIGTSTSGIYLLSEDGQDQIHHFTKSDSPLPSNNITAIAINHQTGEVFIGTDQGTVSYKSDATFGGTEHASNVYAYPNPVESGYSGPIAIKGLVNNAHVSITDVAGNLVYRTRALGGQAIWNGKNLNGEEAHSGVYLVFSTNDDGSQKVATKILLID